MITYLLKIAGLQVTSHPTDTGSMVVHSRNGEINCKTLNACMRHEEGKSGKGLALIPGMLKNHCFSIKTKPVRQAINSSQVLAAIEGRQMLGCWVSEMVC